MNTGFARMGKKEHLGVSTPVCPVPVDGIGFSNETCANPWGAIHGETHWRSKGEWMKRLGLVSGSAYMLDLFCHSCL